MNILLWVLQILLALLCIAGGAFKILKFEELQKDVAAMRELSRGLWAFLGAFECFVGLGLVVPGAINLLPILTPIAAAGVAAESVLVTAFYLNYGDRSPMPYTIAMALMAAFIAYGRFALKPF